MYTFRSNTRAAFEARDYAARKLRFHFKRSLIRTRDGTPKMPNRPAFGRRVAPQTPPAAPKRAMPVAQIATPQVSVPSQSTEAQPSVDQELQAWKATRGSQFRVPWRQLSLMASLCFGIASFVLPDSLNDNVDYLLWGLSAISASVWWTNRKKKTEIKAPAAL